MEGTPNQDIEGNVIYVDGTRELAKFIANAATKSLADGTLVVVDGVIRQATRKNATDVN